MFRLGTNTGLRLTDIRTSGDKNIKFFGIKYAQFTADLLNVSLPDKIIQEQIEEIKTSSKENGL